MALEFILVRVCLQTSLFNYGVVHLTMVDYSFGYNGIAELLA